MSKKILSMILVLCCALSLLNIAYSEKQIEEVNKYTLELAVETALANNIQWQFANKMIELKDLQVTISDKKNNDLKKIERDLREASEQLGDSILALQEEINYIKSLNFSPTHTLNEHWDTLISRPISAKFINDMIKQFNNESMVRAMPESSLITAMENVSQDNAKTYFEITSGKTKTIKETNIAAAQILGLEATRRLTMKQALKIIETSIENGSRILSKTDEDTKRSIELLAENSFYEVVKKQKILAVQEKALQRATEQYKNASESNKQGLLSERELELVLIQLNSTEASLNNAKISLKKAKLDFCVSLGIALDEEFTVIEPEWNLEQIELEKGIELALVNRTDMIKATQDLELAELNLEYVDERHKDNSNEYKESFLYREAKKLEYDSVKINTKVTVTKSYLDWKNAEYVYNKIKDNLELVLNQLKVAEVSFNVGYSKKGENPLITLLNAQEQVAKLEEALTTAEFNRNLAWQNYLKEIGYVKNSEIDK